MVLCSLAVVALIFLSRQMTLIINGELPFVKAVQITAIVCAVVFIAALVYVFVAKKLGKDLKNRVFSARLIIGWATGALICALILYSQTLGGYQYDLAMKLLYGIVAGFFLLYVIWYSFERDCFLFSAGAVFSGAVFYLAYKLLRGGAAAAGISVLAASIAVAAAVAVFAALLMKRDGAVGGRRLLNKKAFYLPIYLFQGIHVIGAGVTIALGFVAAYYMFFVAFGAAFLGIVAYALKKSYR